MVDCSIEHKDRNRFCVEIDSNFSVIAPAGAGKTQLIIDRITSIVNQSKKSKIKRLIVVSYTRKSALEIYERFKNILLIYNKSSNLILGIHQSFFGTVHSFCLHVIRNFGSHLGFTRSINYISNDYDAWMKFFYKNNFLLNIPIKTKKILFRLCSYKDILIVARKLAHQDSKILPNRKNSPKISILKINNFFKNFDIDEVRIRHDIIRFGGWLESWKESGSYDGILDCHSDDIDFVDGWHKTLLPLKKWISNHLYKISIYIAVKFYDYRISRGLLCYDDMNHLAFELINQDLVRRVILQKKFSIIIDEVQDVNRLQLKLLFFISKKQNRHFNSTDKTKPGPGQFCMLGDPQQSIYSSQSNLLNYLKIHKLFIKNLNCFSIVINQNFRCSYNLINFLNKTFSKIFNSEVNVGQINFIFSVPRHNNHLVSQLVKFRIMPRNILSLKLLPPIKKNMEYCEQFAVCIKKYLLNTSCRSEQVAVLSPRNEWLSEMSNFLLRVGVPNQLHLSSNKKYRNPTYSSIVSLIYCLSHPYDSFEIIGLLRDVFEVSNYYINSLHRDFRINLIKYQSVFKNPAIRVLNFLYILKNEITNMSIRCALEHIVRRTKFREKNFYLHGNQKKLISNCINLIEIRAGSAERRNLSFVDWSEELFGSQYRLHNFYQIKKNNIQLMTCHSSKGLEWSIVILPYFFRTLSFGVETYPRLIGTNESSPLQLDKYHVDRHSYAVNRKNEIQEQERLLYVSMTRAKKTLIFVNDRNWFEDDQNSFADVFKIRKNQSNHRLWNRIPNLKM